MTDYVILTKCNCECNVWCKGCRPVWDLQEAGEFLVSNNFTFFFNIDSNGTTATWLRTIVPFRQENGLPRGKFPYEDGLVPSAHCAPVFYPHWHHISFRC